jgi:hypothetical protein
MGHASGAFPDLSRHPPDFPPERRCGRNLLRLEHTGRRRDGRAQRACRLGALQGEEGLEAYRLANNVVSIDGLSTGYVSDDF